MTTSPCIAIVDSYAPTKALVDQFKRSGCNVVRVQSGREVPFAFRIGQYRHTDYANNILSNLIHEGDLSRTAEQTGRFAPVAVIAGTETGVELADALSEKIGTPGNGTKLSAARRDKYLMNEALRHAGIAAVRQIRAQTEDELEEWHRKNGGRIVVKPVASGGGDSVFFCDTPEQSAEAFTRIHRSENILSMRNFGVVAQEYLSGVEYMINTVSCHGLHRVCEIWRTTRLTANGVLDLTEGQHLVREIGSAEQRLINYSHRVLDVLGIMYGPAHLEMKSTSRGPVLLEAGARLCGGNLP
ncbi:ATP-grasp domain-containing protein, partial [Nocardia sp. 2]